MRKVSKEEYLRDLENTYKEAAAYKMLSRGYQILSELPENQVNGQNRLLAFKSEANASNERGCKNLLGKMEEYNSEWFKEFKPK